MSKENEILWKYTLNLERKGTLEYKFTKGNWNNEAVGPDGIKKPNFITSVTSIQQSKFHCVVGVK
jgi:hypothetical protein